VPDHLGRVIGAGPSQQPLHQPGYADPAIPVGGHLQHNHELRHRQREQQRGPRTQPACRGLARAVTWLGPVPAGLGIPAVG
jgi:hypothetical protein